MQRGGDGGVADTSKVGPQAPGKDDGTAIPALPGEAGAGPGKPPTAVDAPDDVARQGELELVPLPGEAGDPEADATAAETADGQAPDADDAATARAPQDGAPDADSEPAGTPGASDAGGRGPDWA